MSEKQRDTSQQAQLYDASQMAVLYADIARRSGELINQYLHRGAKGGLSSARDELGITEAFFQAWSRVLADPMRLAEAQLKYWQDAVTLWQHATLRMLGQEAKPVAEPGSLISLCSGLSDTHSKVPYGTRKR